MEKPTKAQAARTIVEIISNAPSQTVTGPYLGSIIKFKFRPPDLDEIKLTRV